MKAFYKILAWAIAIVTIAALIAGCKVTQQRCQELYPNPRPDTITTERVEYRERVRDTTIYIENDAAMFSAWVSCDSLNTALLDSIQTSEGRYIQLRHKVERNAAAMRLMFECKVDSQGVYFQWRERDTTAAVYKTEKQYFAKLVPANNTRWEKFKIATGDYTFPFTCLILIAGIGWAAVKLFKPKI